MFCEIILIGMILVFSVALSPFLRAENLTVPTSFHVLSNCELNSIYFYIQCSNLDDLKDFRENFSYYGQKHSIITLKNHLFICVHCFNLCSLVFHLCSLVFHLCSLVFHLCLLVFYLCSFVFYLCSFVFICVHLCSFVFICVHLCSFVFTCVPTCVVFYTRPSFTA